MIPIPDHLIAKPAPPRPGQVRADESAAMEAFSHLFAPHLRNVLACFFAARHRHACDGLAPSLDAARILRDEAAATLASEGARRLFLHLADGQIATEAAKMRRHAETEEQAWHDASSEAFLAQQLADAASHWNDAAAARQCLKNGWEEIARRGAQTGRSDADIAARRARFASDFAMTRIMALAHHDPAAGLAYYHRNRDLIAPALRPELERGLDRAQEDSMVSRAADYVLEGHPFDEAGMDRVAADGTDPAARLPLWLDRADRLATWTRPGSDLFRRRLRREVAGRIALAVATGQREARRSRNALLAAALGAGGTPPLSLAEILADPQLHLAWIKAPPKVQDAVEGHIALNRQGRRPVGRAGRAIRHGLLALRVLDLAAFRALDFGHPAFAAMPVPDHLEMLAAQADDAPPPDPRLHALLHAAGDHVAPAHL